MLLLYVGTCSTLQNRGDLGHRLVWLYLLGGLEISFDESPITSPSFLAMAAFGKMPSLFCKPQSRVRQSNEAVLQCHAAHPQSAVQAIGCAYHQPCTPSAYCGTSVPDPHGSLTSGMPVCLSFQIVSCHLHASLAFPRSDCRSSETLLLLPWGAACHRPFKP